MVKVQSCKWLLSPSCLENVDQSPRLLGYCLEKKTNMVKRNLHSQLAFLPSEPCSLSSGGLHVCVHMCPLIKERRQCPDAFSDLTSNKGIWPWSLSDECHLTWNFLMESPISNLGPSAYTHIAVKHTGRSKSLWGAQGHHKHCVNALKYLYFTVLGRLADCKTGFWLWRMWVCPSGPSWWVRPN